MGDIFYTVRHKDKWATRKEGCYKVIKVFNTQKEAMNYSKQKAQISNGEHRIQGRDGKFRDADSYGNDNFPPKG